MKIDFKKFHKIECDDDCTTLEHPAGHQIKIAHSKLAPELKEELEKLPIKMARGGNVRSKWAQKYDPNMASKNSKPSQPAMANKSVSGQPPHSALRTYTEPDDAGPDVVLAALEREAPPMGAKGTGPMQHYPPCINPSCKSFGKSHPNCRCYGGAHGSAHEAGQFAEGGKVEEEYYCDDNRAHKKGCEYYKGGEVKGVHTSSMEVDKPKDKKEKKWAGESEAGQDLRNADINDASKRHAKKKHHKVLGELHSMKGPNIKGLAAGGFAEGEHAVDQGLDKEMLGAEMAADAADNKPENVASELNNEVQSYQKDLAAPQPVAEAQPAQQQEMSPQVATPAPQEQQPVAKVEMLQQHKSNNLKQLGDEAQMFQADLDAGHIKPETYSSLFAKKDTLGKIGTLFGLLLSGAGSGLTGQPNMLLQMMNKQIENDLQAQQQSVGNQQNYLKINQQNLMNQAQAKNIDADTNTKAYALARVQMNNAALHSLVENTNKLPDGPQKQQALQTLAMMNQQVQNDNFNILDRAATASALGSMLLGNDGQSTMLMKSGMLGPEAKEVGADVEHKTIPGIPGKAARPIESKDRDQIQAMKVLSDKAADLIKFSKENVGTISQTKRKQAAQKAEELVNFYNHSIQGGVLTEGRLKWLDEQISKNPTGIVTQLLGNNARLQEIKDSNDHRMNLLLGSYGFPVNKVSHVAGAPQEQIKVVNGVKYKRGPNGEAIKVE